MHSFFTAFFDTLFPPSQHEKIVRDTSFKILKVACTPHTFGEVTALASYHTPLVRAFIHEAKFHRNERAIALFGQLLGEHLHAAFPLEMPRAIHLIPIPLSAERLRERGYNQVLAIARSARARVPHLVVHENILQKIHRTPSQTSLSRAERLKNLAGVFAVGGHAPDPTLPPDACIILFDDIVTTGSTLSEASRTLREAGFTHIEQLAIAH